MTFKYEVKVILSGDPGYSYMVTTPPNLQDILSVYGEYRDELLDWCAAEFRKKGLVPHHHIFQYTVNRWFIVFMDFDEVMVEFMLKWHDNVYHSKEIS